MENGYSAGNSQGPKPKELTKDLIMNLRQRKDSSLKMNGCLQIIDLKEDGSFMTLSDGFSYSEVALFKTIRSKIKELDIHLFDILSVTMLLHKETINVLVNFDCLYSNMSNMIGRPIEFTDYQEKNYTNIQGDNKLPRSLWMTPDMIPKTGFSTGGNAGKISRGQDLADDEFTPISLLTNGATGWMVKARVTKKGQKKEFNSHKGGKGCVFSCVLIDNSGEIQATFFTEAAEKYFNILQDNNVYIFASGEIRKSNNFNSTSNQYEVNFSVKSEISPCDDDGKIDNVKFNFVRIVDIPKKELKSSCDVIGIISEITEPTEIQLRNGESKLKQNAKIKDDSLFEIEVNIWGELGGREHLVIGNTVIVSDVQISDYKGRVLNTKSTSKVLTQFPDLPRVRELITWRNHQSKNPQAAESIKTLQPEIRTKNTLLVTVSQYRKIADDVIMSDNEKKEYFTINGYVTAFGNSFFYDKCPNDNCFKKVTSEDPSLSECGNCGQVRKPPIPKFIGMVKVTDHTGSIFLNFSSDQQGLILFDKSAQELKDLQALSKEELQAYFKTRYNVSYAMKVYAKKEYYNGEMKVKYHVAGIYEYPKKLKEVNGALLNTLNKYKRMLNSVNA